MMGSYGMLSIYQPTSKKNIKIQLYIYRVTSSRLVCRILQWIFLDVVVFKWGFLLVGILYIYSFLFYRMVMQFFFLQKIRNSHCYLRSWRFLAIVLLEWTQFLPNSWRVEEGCHKAAGLERVGRKLLWVIKLVKSKGFFVLKRKLRRNGKIGEEEHVRYTCFSYRILEKIIVDQRVRVVIGSQGWWLYFPSNTRCFGLVSFTKTWFSPSTT